MKKIVLALAVSAVAGLLASPPAGAASRPALPSSQLEFGLSNGPNSVGWMTGTGVPWKYRYTYLAGGVYSGGWQTWQDPALPAGQYALDYMRDSAAHGYIPVFPYYMLLQSNHPSDEATDDYNNLNNAGLMNRYYADFTVLMQRSGTFGGTVIVHVEPDLWGYLQQRSGNSTADTVSASVASSGNPDVAGLSNTVQGFATALLNIRDRYAPNALLAFHASPWSSLRDIGTDTDPTLNAAAEADKTARFFNSAAGSRWDLVFNDVDDHDAGWWEAQGRNHWWDPTNATVPNFARYLAWVTELRAQTGRPQVVWQVPVGNQYYLTMNNTCGHYQDNVAEYFISHASSLYSAGLIAVLFGAGNGCQTTNEDSQNDGITNNGGAATVDAYTASKGWCSGCNTHTSMVSDDDGGFLRTFVGAYYAQSSYVPPPPAAYHPVTPFRIFDSRSGGSQFAPETAQAVQVAGAGVIPAGATAVVLNVGVTNTHGGLSGYVQVLPHGSARGTASTVNYLAGQTIASLTQVGLSAGYVDVFNAGAFTDVFLDVQGYYGPGAGSGVGLYNSLPSPFRFLDTRGRLGLGPGGALRLQVAGQHGIPSDAQAVVFNLTEVGGTAPSYLAAWPDGQSRPEVSNLNFPAGRVLANRAIVTLGGGWLDISNSQGTADVLVDVVGWYSGGLGTDTSGRQFQPSAPTRLFDTRSGLGGHPGRLGAGESTYVGAPSGINGPVSVNVTALNASTNSYLGVYPNAPSGPPSTSDLNFQPGDILPNLVVTAGNRFAVYNSVGAVDVFVDLTGSYA